jgi:hypothetical protein
LLSSTLQWKPWPWTLRRFSLRLSFGSGCESGNSSSTIAPVWSSNARVSTISGVSCGSRRRLVLPSECGSGTEPTFRMRRRSCRCLPYGFATLRNVSRRRRPTSSLNGGTMSSVGLEIAGGTSSALAESSPQLITLVASLRQEAGYAVRLRGASLLWAAAGACVNRSC